ncbi:MAG: hypothetical protein NWE98_04150 [Candidatus Bathyarchaeota archaeon]|nr:hypothetical protein [Candidatus Bathyarchaeota archaeon]
MSRTKSNPWVEGLITAVSIGGFLIILGAVFGLTPGIPQKTSSFFSDLKLVSFPLDSGTISLFAPANPQQHLDFFTAVFNFLLGIGILQIVILAIRFWAHSPVGKTSETVGSAVFWLGGAAAASVYLLAGTQNGWFQFWSMLLVLIGVSLIVRFIILFTAKRLKK